MQLHITFGSRRMVFPGTKRGRAAQKPHPVKARKNPSSAEPGFFAQVALWASLDWTELSCGGEGKQSERAALLHLLFIIGRNEP